MSYGPPVELQEPSLRVLVVHFSWPNAPRFPDTRGALTDVLRGVTGSADDWMWDGPLVATWQDERQLHLIATSTGLDIVSEAPEDPVSIAQGVLPAVMEILNLDQCACGAAAVWLLAAPDLREASAALEARLAHSDLRTVLEPIGGRPSRFAVDLTFEDQDLRTQLEIKPVDAEYLSDGPEFLSELEVADLPPAAGFFRLRRERTERETTKDALDQVKRLLDGVQQAGTKIAATLTTD